jgi:hypothetical protein
MGDDLADLSARAVFEAIRDIKHGGAEFFPGFGSIAKRCHQLKRDWRKQLKCVRQLISEHARLTEEAEAAKKKAAAEQRAETFWRSKFGNAAPTVTQLDRAPIGLVYEDNRPLTLSQALYAGRHWAPEVVRGLAAMVRPADAEIETFLRCFGLTRRPRPSVPAGLPEFDRVAHERQIGEEMARIQRLSAPGFWSTPKVAPRRRRRKSVSR